MGRAATILGIWILGYVIGFIGYIALVETNAIGFLISALVRIFGNSQIVAASLVGLATSFLSLVIVIAWSYWGSSNKV